jgi:PAS domain S-box-containing protein
MDDRLDQRDPSLDPPSFQRTALALVVFDLAWLLLTALGAWSLLDNAQLSIIVVLVLQSVPIIIGGVLVFRLGRGQADVLTMQRELAQRSYDRFYAVTEVAGDVTYTARVASDGDVVFEWVTASFEARLGQSLETLRLQGGWRSQVHVDDWPSLLRRIPALLAGQSTISEYRVRTATGGWRWLRDRVSPLPGQAAGREIALVGTLIDITGQRSADAAVRDSEATLRNLVDSVPLMMGLVEVNGDDVRILSANAATAQYLEQTADELTSQPISAFGIAADFIRLGIEQLIESRRTARPTRFEFQYPADHDGQWWAATVAPIVGTNRFSYVLDDITKPRQREETLRLSEQKFRSFIEQAFDGMVLVGEDGRVIEWNQALEKITGLSRKHTVGQRYLTLLLELTPDDSKAVMADDLERMLMEALNTGEADFLNRPTEWPTQFGGDPAARRSLLQHAAFPIRAGSRYRLGVVIRDITALSPMAGGADAT